MPTRTPCTGGRNGDPSFLICLNAPEAMLTASAPVERPTSRTGLEADTMLKPLDQEQENDLDDVMCDYGLVRYDSYNT